MAKDRARPFSRKHRQYWLPVTGVMVLIGSLNVGLGYCTYSESKLPRERIVPVLPPVGTPSAIDGSIGVAEIPAPVMRAFAVAYPRHIPTARRVAVAGGQVAYELSFTENRAVTHVVYRPDGAVVGAP